MFDTPFDRPFDHSYAATLDDDDEADLVVPYDDGGPVATEEVVPAAPQRRRGRLYAGIAALVVLAAAWLWLPHGGTAASAMPVPVVTTAQPLARSIT